MREKFKKLLLIFYFWTLGFVGGILFWLLRIFGRVEVQGYRLKKLIPPKEGLIVIYNHPSLFEPALLPFLFFPWYLFSPRMIPFSTPAKEYYDQWWFLPFRPVSIPIQRNRAEKRYKFLKQLLQKIKEGKVIILAPEGGRTFKEGEFKIIEQGKILIKRDWRELKEKSQKIIRRFQSGLSFLLKTQVTFLPIWAEPKISFFPLPRFWIRIKIGKPLKGSEVSNLEELEDLLLKCSG